MKIALIHEWLDVPAGSEKVLSLLLDLYPQADIFCLVDFLSPQDRQTLLRGKKTRTSFIQRLPGARKHFRKYLPVMPLAIEQFDLRGYDLIISSSHCVAKGVITGPDQLHICYCHSPMRYIWDLQHQYLAEAGLKSGLRSWLTRYLFHRLRTWDTRSSAGVDYFVANSGYIARRINKAWRRPASVIYPGIDTERYPLCELKKNSYLVAGRMVPYKQVHVVVEAFAKMPERQLVIIGDGPSRKKIEKLATDNVQVLGYQPEKVLISYLQQARALVFMGEEDFGLLPVEAQLCGTPVIAFGRGGVTETVIDGKTGLLVSEQNADSLMKTLDQFESSKLLSPAAIRDHAMSFSRSIFVNKFSSFVEKITMLSGRGSSSATRNIKESSQNRSHNNF